MLTIKILGSGCPNCQKLAYLTERAVEHLCVEANIEKVTDHARILEYNVMATPGLVINGQLVSCGRIPSEAEISTFLTTALSEN